MIDGPRVRFGYAYERGHGTIDETELGDHDELPWGSFEPDARGEYIQSDQMSYSDYVGTLCERANVEIFSERFGDYLGQEWWRLYGGHGTNGVVVRRDADERVPEIGEFFEDLETALCASEDRLQALEMEQRDEQWRIYGGEELRRQVEKLYQNEVAIEPEDRVLRVRYLLQKLFPRLDPLFDELDDEVLVQLLRATGLDDEGDDLDYVWHEAMQYGHGDEERSEDAVNYHFDIPAGINLFLKKVVGQQRFQVALDLLLELGGEWVPAAARIVRGVK